jgi:hypothetical protein
LTAKVNSIVEEFLSLKDENEVKSGLIYTLHILSSISFRCTVYLTNSDFLCLTLGTRGVQGAPECRGWTPCSKSDQQVSR